jgi:uncharacterized membrane protein
MQRIRRALMRSVDLAVASTLALLLMALMVIDSGSPVTGSARLVVGLLFVLFVPGYCLLAALIPRPQTLDPAERIGISVGVSIALIPVLALILNYGLGGLRPWPIVLTETVVSLALAAVALWQRSRLDDEPAAAEPTRFRLSSWLRQLTPVERIVFPVVLVAAVAAGAVSLVTLTAPSPDDLMTELYVLGAGGLAEQLPREVEAGTPVSVTLGLVNHELFRREYRFEAWGSDAWSPDKRTQIVPPTAISLAPREGVEWPMTWRMAEPGPDQAIDLLVYVDGERQPYRKLRLWLDVRAPSGGETASSPGSVVRTAGEGIEADLARPAGPGVRPTPVVPNEHLPLSIPAPVAAGTPTQPVSQCHGQAPDDTRPSSHCEEPSPDHREPSAQASP